MITLELNRYDFERLYSLLEGRIPVKSEKNTNNIRLTGNKHEFEEILDKLMDILQEIGIDLEGNINSIGISIEKIIDVISPIVYES